MAEASPGATVLLRAGARRCGVSPPRLIGRLLCLGEILLLATICLLPALAAADTRDEAAASIAATLKAADLGRILVTPVRGPNDAANQSLTGALESALLAAKVKIADRQALAASLGEKSLEQLGATQLSEAGGAAGAESILIVEQTPLNGIYIVSGKVVGVQGGEVKATARAEYEDASASGLTQEASTVQAQLRRLSDKLVRALDSMEGDLRYQRFAILNFEENGESTKSKQLGRLVAAELTTLLQRDHGLMLVERDRIAAVVDELALGQTGLLDESKTAEVGQMAGAQGLILGTVSEAGATYRVHTKVVSAEAGTLVATEETDLPAADLVALSSEAVVLRTRVGAFYRSLLLPGWGQVYNRQPVKGGLFAGVEAATIGGAVAFHMLGIQAERRYERMGPGSNFDAQRGKAERFYLLRNVFLFAIGGVHLANILDAVISGKTYDSATPSSSTALGQFRW